MNIPHERWYHVIERRRSRRSFDPKPLEARSLSQIVTVCTNFRPFRSARTKVVTESPDTVFKGVIDPHGKIKGAPAFIVFSGKNG